MVWDVKRVTGSEIYPKLLLKNLKNPMWGEQKELQGEAAVPGYTFNKNNIYQSYVNI